MSGRAFKEKQLEDEQVRLVVDEAALAAPEEPVCVKDEFPDLGDRYEVLGLIGSGGMGTVWKVRDLSLDRILAIKLLRPEMLKDETAVKRFEQEARLAADLTHMNIASIYGPGKDSAGHPFIIMNYVDGESLADILAREGKLDEERAMGIFHQICDALTHSHMKGVIHRDIKPSNIIISKTESGAYVVHVVDFGIAKSIYGDVQSTQALTRTEDTFGSPLYMSPEQLLGDEVSEQSDIYSLGCVLYEMLTGRPPFIEKNPVKLLVQHFNGAVDLSDIPPRLKIPVDFCLQKQAQSRPKSMEQLLECLADSLATTTYKNSHEIEALLPILGVLYVISMSFVCMTFSDAFDRASCFLLFSIFVLSAWFMLQVARSRSALKPSLLADFSSLLLASLIVSILSIFSTRSLLGPIAMVQLGLFFPILRFCKRRDFQAKMPIWTRSTKLSMLSQVQSQRAIDGFAHSVVVLAAILTVLAWLPVVVPSDLALLDASLLLSFPLILLGLSSLVVTLQKWSYSPNHSSDKVEVLFLSECRHMASRFLVSCALFALVIQLVLGSSVKHIARQVCLYGNKLPTETIVRIANETMRLPHTDRYDVTRLYEVQDLLSRDNQMAYWIEPILSQIIDNKSDQIPILRSSAFLGYCSLLSRQNKWEEAKQYFDKSLMELKKGEVRHGLADLPAFFTRGLIKYDARSVSLDLALLAQRNYDLERVKNVVDFIEQSKIKFSAAEQQEFENAKRWIRYSTRKGSGWEATETKIRN
ncbi:MAG: serine/threonine protein kinase [Cyanobacteria bacterium SZAS TMP-1]|nr:serine/threonine protein kinase [Cyanobacteria bacterium SZAS TMP-1]